MDAELQRIPALAAGTWSIYEVSDYLGCGSYSSRVGVASVQHVRASLGVAAGVFACAAADRGGPRASRIGHRQRLDFHPCSGPAGPGRFRAVGERRCNRGESAPA